MEAASSVPVVSLVDDSQEQLSNALEDLKRRLSTRLLAAQSWVVPTDHHYDTYIEDLQAFLEQGALALSVFQIDGLDAVTEAVKKLEEQFTVLEGIADGISRPSKRLKRTPSGPEDPDLVEITDSLADTQIDDDDSAWVDTMIDEPDENSLRRQGAQVFEENSQGAW